MDAGANSGETAGPQGEAQDAPSKTGVRSFQDYGSVAERFKAPVLKTGDGSNRP